MLISPRLKHLAASLAANPEKREAQRTLAQEVTRMVHGDEAVKKAKQASMILFGEEISNLSLTRLAGHFCRSPFSPNQIKTALSGEGLGIIDILASVGLAQSKGEARRLAARRRHLLE